MGFPGADQTGSIDDFNSERTYSLMTAHSNTVVGNEALVLDAAARYPALNAYGLNPSLIKSNIRAAVLGDRIGGAALPIIAAGSPIRARKCRRGSSALSSRQFGLASAPIP